MSLHWFLVGYVITALEMTFENDFDAWEEIADYRVPWIQSIPDEPEGLDPYGRRTLSAGR